MWKLGCSMIFLALLFETGSISWSKPQTSSWSLRPSRDAQDEPQKTSHFLAGSASVSKWTSDGSFTCHRSHLRTCLWCSSWLYFLCRLTCCSPMECRGCGGRVEAQSWFFLGGFWDRWFVGRGGKNPQTNGWYFSPCHPVCPNKQRHF